MPELLLSVQKWAADTELDRREECEPSLSSRDGQVGKVDRVGRAQVMARKRGQDQTEYHLEAWRTFTVTEVLFCDQHFSHIICFNPHSSPKRYYLPHFIGEDTEAQGGYKSKVTQLGMVGVF